MKQIKFTEEKLEFIIDQFVKMVESISDEKRRTALLTMVEELSERLFSAPASPALNYHNCCVGGLAEHSLRVYNNLRKMRDSFCQKLSDDSIITVALFHDLGKLGTVEEPYYIDEDNSWMIETRGVYYKHNMKLDYLGVAQRSIRLLTHYGVDLTEEEYKAILIHDGQYIPENKPYAHKEGWLGLLLHQADMIACRTEQEKWESLQ